MSRHPHFYLIRLWNNQVLLNYRVGFLSDENLSVTAECWLNSLLIIHSCLLCNVPALWKISQKFVVIPVPTAYTTENATTKSIIFMIRVLVPIWYLVIFNSAGGGALVLKCVLNSLFSFAMTATDLVFSFRVIITVLRIRIRNIRII